MTKTESPLTPPSNEPRPFWTRRFLVATAALFMPLPFVFAWADSTSFNTVAGTDDFWTGVWFGYRAELFAFGVFLMISSVFPRLREIFEMPDERGDERELMISANARHIAYAAAMTMLVIPGLLAQAGIASMPAEALIYMAIALELIYRASMIYFGKKL